MKYARKKYFLLKKKAKGSLGDEQRKAEEELEKWASLANDHRHGTGDWEPVLNSWFCEHNMDSEDQDTAPYADTLKIKLFAERQKLNIKD